VDPAGSPQASQPRQIQYSEQTRFVTGKNFFQNGSQWVDAAVQKTPNAGRLRVQFGSPEYFDLIAKHPQTAAWLALGQSVQFVFGGAIYEIYE
jgi:hypothetical protein